LKTAIAGNQSGTPSDRYAAPQSNRERNRDLVDQKLGAQHAKRQASPHDPNDH